MPSRFRLFMALLWAKIRGAGKWLIAAIILIAILIASFFAFNNDDNKKDDSSNRPEVAQVYEPSIGTPLPPDVNESSATTTTPSNATSSDATASDATSNGQVASANTTATFTAPPAGVDISRPIHYSNSTIGIKATLPAQSIVTEKTGSVIFYSKAGSLLYNVDTVTTTDNLASIRQQLQPSPDVTNITEATFAGNPALQFTYKYLTGYVIVKNNTAYYIIGKPQHLNNIAI